MLYNHEKTHFMRKIFARVPCPSLSFDVYSNSCPLSWWCHPNISSSTAPFSYCPQSFPTWGSFPINQLFTSGGQSIRTSASDLSLKVGIQSWFLLGWTGLISLQSKGLSRVFSSTTVQKHQLFGAQPSLWMIFTYLYFENIAQKGHCLVWLWWCHTYSLLFFQNPKPLLAESSLVCQRVDRKTFSSQ